MITIDFNYLAIEPGHFILDIGCGEGRHVIQACKKKDTHVIGADFSYDDLIKSKNKLAFHQAINDLACKDHLLSAMDLTNLPFGEHAFDRVICSEVLEHIPDDRKAMGELVRILKPGGILAVSVPRFVPEKICWLLSKAYVEAKGGHVRIYRKRELVSGLESLGTRLFASHFAHSLHAPYWWLKCLVGPDNTQNLSVRLFHELLVWEMMKKPSALTGLDRIFNPVFGKSLVLYFRKF